MDTRKLQLDGCKPQQIVAVDIVEDYWIFGLRLCKDKETLPVSFGNIISDESFTRSLGLFNVVWTGMVLHVLGKEQTLLFLQKVFHFLHPDGIYFETCLTTLQSEGTNFQVTPQSPVYYLHTVGSLEEAMKEVGFVDVIVKPEEYFKSTVPTLTTSSVQIVSFIAKRKK